MKKIGQHLKRYTAAILLLVAVFTLFSGSLWAKYTQSMTVTNVLKVTAKSGSYITYAAPNHIRIKVNVKLVDASGNTTAAAGVPITVRRLLSPTFVNAGWTDQVVLLSGTSDKDGIVYFDSAYLYDSTSKAAWLGSTQEGTNGLDNCIFFQSNAGTPIRFDINPQDGSGYALNMTSKEIRNCIKSTNAGAVSLATGDGAGYDDFEFHGGLAENGAYVEFDLYVQSTTTNTGDKNLTIVNEMDNTNASTQ